MNCLETVSRKVDEFYRLLTHASSKRRSSAPALLTGTLAFLDVDAPDEPYKAGIRFSVIPPGKRLTDVSQLSGGERTIAAAALLFAIISFRRPPFVMVDEMDAALDKKNVQALGSFLRAVGMQVLVITLKDSLFGKADGLVGVYKPLAEGSKLACLDLRGYRDGDDEDEEESAALPPIAGG